MHFITYRHFISFLKKFNAKCPAQDIADWVPLGADPEFSAPGIYQGMPGVSLCGVDRTPGHRRSHCPVMKAANRPTDLGVLERTGLTAV